MNTIGVAADDRICMGLAAGRGSVEMSLNNGVG